MNEEPMVKAIIFDCFGVLYIPSSQSYFSRFPDQYSQLHELNKQCDKGLLERDEFIQQVSDITHESPEDVHRAVRTENVINLQMITFIQTTLKPQYKIGLLSNIGKGWLSMFFNNHQLNNLFDAAVVSGEIGAIKPAVQAYTATAEKLGVEPKACLFVDDNPDNCAGAQAAGMQATVYDNSSQTIKELRGRLQLS